MKELAMATLVAGGVCTADATSASLPLTQEWDKTFPKSDKVEHAKVTFKNRFGITLAADVYKPVGSRVPRDRYPAIAVSGPFGAVKEQSSGLLRADARGARLPDHRLRSVLHGRVGRHAALRRFA